MSRRQPEAVPAGVEGSSLASVRVTLCAVAPLSPRASQLVAALEGAGAQVNVAAAPSLAASGIVLWTDPAGRDVPVPGGALNVVDLHGRAACDPAGVLAHCQDASLLLAGSEAEHGFWVGALAALRLSIPVTIVPYAVAASTTRRPAKFDKLLIVQGRSPSPGTRAAVQRALAWAAERGVATEIADPVGPAGLEAVHRARLDAKARGTVVFDARIGPDELVAPPLELIEALAKGAPVLAAGEGPLALELEAEGAGRALHRLEAGLDAIAALPPPRLQAMAEAARGYARRRFAPERAASSLVGALRRALARAEAREALWNGGGPVVGPGGRVLVISDEAPNLLAVRVQIPFRALHRRGAIDGYTVLSHGEVVFSTDQPTPDTSFDAVWVHRTADPSVHLLLQSLGCGFVYDVDDNLLVSPCYRPAFSAATIETARAMLRACTVLSCATPALFESLRRRHETPLAAKAVITPNLADARPRAVEPGPPLAVVWASSDRPALTESRAEVERALRDFCLAHSVKLVCLGAEPSPVLAGSGLEIEHIGLLSYPAYLARLRDCAPGILVGPLETGADPDTQEFVDAKGDVKLIDARQAGLVPVLSRARPYADSDLSPPVLCENTYESWLEGLERAHRICLDPPPPSAWPPPRSADQLGPMPWAQALKRARLETPITLASVLDAVRFMREQQQTLLVRREAFDEAYYLAMHEDVRLAVEQGTVPSGYDHYRASGYDEGRTARHSPTPQAQADAWWAGLLNTVSFLEAEVEGRAPAIERLRSRVRLRRSLGSAPSPPPPPPKQAPASQSDLVWHPPGARSGQPCPVCDAPGPHPVLLVAEGENLIRCDACASCFYERRVAHDYECEQNASVLLQLYLEQNASIYHQTRLLFAIDDPAINSILDVGCGFGYPVDLAAKVLGWRATGIDPSFYATEGAALLGADIRKAYLTENTEPGDEFGLVMASEVIEHVPDPYTFLALLRRWLRPGGTLALTTPDAAALRPDLGPGSLTGILAVRVHLVLFTAASLDLALRRAGFRHVHVESVPDGLVAYASDRPLRLRAEAAERHAEAYRRYLEHLVHTAPPGEALWNGAAGRLFTLLGGGAELSVLHALYACIASAWRDRFGIDLARLRLPATLPERAFIARDECTRPERVAATQPLNLAAVLLNRAVLEHRTPGRTAESVLQYARPAYLFAVQTRRVLAQQDMIDLDLKRVAWQARALMVDCLAELAPELEGELLFALAQDSPGALHDQVDPPEDALIARIAPFFTKCVQTDRFDEASRLEPWMRDLDRLCRVTATEPERMLRALFAMGVQRLIHHRAPGPALEAFERMGQEARIMLNIPTRADLARHFLPVAEQHRQLAAAQLRATGAPAKSPAA